MEQIVNILCGHQDTNLILEHMEALITAADSVLSSDSSSSSSSSSNESSADEDDRNKGTINQDIQNEDVKSEDTKTEVIKKDDKNKVVIVEPKNFVNVIDKYNPEEFKGHMRIKPSTAQFLIDGFSSSQYIPQLSHGGRQCVSGKKSVYMYLWYIGNYITFTQLAELFGVSKSTAWMTVKRVSSWLISIGHEHIKWPKEPEHISQVQKKFQEKKNIPGIMGAISCTRINIRPPGKEKDSYLDRHQSYSLVLQAIADADKKFIDIACGEPGSLHDYNVLRKSGVYLQAVTNVDELFPNNSFLLGDAAYPSSRWILPPYINYGNLCKAQKKFNDIHAATRVVVKNAFDLLKMRFRKLQKFSEQIHIPTLTNLIVSACVLHNICIAVDDVHITVGTTEYDNQYEIESEVYNDVFPEDFSSRDFLFNYLLQANLI